MIQKDTAFYSEGSRLEATLYYPEDAARDGAPRPALVVNSGYQGFNEFYPKMFAERMTERGFVCLGFDYRGMADSEGEKGRVLIEEQAQDVRNAVTFLRAQEGIDPRRIGLVGWGMGAANVILAAEKGGDVAGVASLNGFYDGERWLKSIHTYDEFQKIVAEVAEDRTNRVLNGESRLADTFEHYPLDPATGDYVEKELSQVYGFGHPTRLQFTESILDLKVQNVVANLAPTPLFLAHGERNSLHPYDEAAALYEAAASPKTLYTIDGRHNDFMFVDHPEFVALCDRLRDFFDVAFTESAAPARTVSA
ncbi:alpha/beta hydrolase [Streptomyces sp. NPDC008163]|uniref:Alpha/beta hydrolase n=1 Tax=Streptomyces drozdowiczii TaxID=202862 RepID=A0ABY6PPZ4_9ACTN|nr:alpha/beta hydrolase [Streptomyces drozdowiczii]MCX0246654.1 alpha/beta hydrolase [Streptomyces drozdowiczii]UZK53869.1 alpha/beta hydrolase [Streptomyces drozdowiczii]